MVLELSREITSEMDLKILATNGLGVSENVIAAQLYDRRHSITEAAHQVIINWRKSIENPYKAYSELCDALRKTNMTLLIGKVLK